MIIKNLSKREKIIALVTAALFAGVVTYSMVIEPAASRWSAVTEEAGSKAAMVTRDRALLAKYKEIEAEYRKYPALSEKGKKDEEERARILAEIERISKKTSAYVANIKPRETKAMDGYKEISLEVTAEGAKTELSQFLYEIEASNIILRVRHFTITSQQTLATKLKGVFVITKILF